MKIETRAHPVDALVIPRLKQREIEDIYLSSRVFSLSITLDLHNMHTSFFWDSSSLVIQSHQIRFQSFAHGRVFILAGDCAFEESEDKRTKTIQCKAFALFVQRYKKKGRKWKETHKWRSEETSSSPSITVKQQRVEKTAHLTEERIHAFPIPCARRTLWISINNIGVEMSFLS